MSDADDRFVEDIHDAADRQSEINEAKLPDNTLTREQIRDRMLELFKSLDADGIHDYATKLGRYYNALVAENDAQRAQIEGQCAVIETLRFNRILAERDKKALRAANKKLRSEVAWLEGAMKKAGKS